MPADVLDARQAWNSGADAYIQYVESGADYYRHLVHGPGLFAACGEVRGLDALDVGCGHGYFSRLLARGGARVTGVDLSDKLIAHANKMEGGERLGITYQLLDAACISEAFDAEKFDLVTGCMSLQDMADPRAVLAGANRVLRPRGRCVFSVPHPATNPVIRNWQRDQHGRKLALHLDQYFHTGPAICQWNMPRLSSHWKTPYRRFTLTEWSAMIAAAGFVIKALSEPRPDSDLVAAYPKLDDCSRMPYFLVFEIVKRELG